MKITIHSLRFILTFIVLCNVFSLITYKSYGQFDFGKSYINVTKGLNGGTVEPGDTLEIRASIVVRRSGASNTVINNCVFNDVVPAGTSFIPGTIRVLTNEGKIFRQFTDGSGDDQGYISGTSIRIYLGYTAGDAPATSSAGGRIRNTHIPNFGNSCIMLASFRVRVTLAIGSMINTGGGSVSYTSGLTNITFPFPSNTVAIYTNYGICANTVGVNALGTESNGTFGSGTNKDRAASANVPAGYTYSAFSANMPNDYYYGVSNNTSVGGTGFSTSNAWPKPDNSSPSHRVFSVWDIIGDHTGAASPTLGNPAAANGANRGYMLVVNAAYKIDSAFQHTITGLCSNTFYEVSFWMRNICSKCGSDLNGVNASSGSSAYIPTAPGDSSGVNPNLSFDINGIDYYTTGNLRYTGQWVKKGFTYLTGPSETSITLKIMNNAPGGGGNDWALDDITVATCSPNFSFTPSPNPMICDSNVVTMSATISSFFPNYTHYKWQRSNDGVTWFDTGVGSPPLPTPVWNGSSYVYTVNYPPFVGYTTDNGIRFRVIVSTTSGNLAIPNCQLTDGNTNITLNIIDCGEVLSTNIVSFTGQFQNGKSNLSWTTNMEPMPYIFEIEKSFDGKNFTTIASTNSYGNLGANINTYTFTDPVIAQETAFYRIKMTGKEGFVKYSRIVKMILGDNNVTVSSIVNPFNSQLDFYLNAPLNSNGEADLLDAFGRPVKKVKFTLAAGNNHITINGTQGLPAGAYTLRIKTDNKAISKPVIKLNK